jgi:hypothetical protein
MGIFSSLIPGMPSFYTFSPSAKDFPPGPMADSNWNISDGWIPAFQREMQARLRIGGLG